MADKLQSRLTFKWSARMPGDHEYSSGRDAASNVKPVSTGNVGQQLAKEDVYKDEYSCQMAAEGK
uniref:HDC03028 n=1 Tax=Drosophila melanogaster TaxID=7227 RepID=Q6IH82_DROME|nr:TPA_inf: HDC03028 [Drosophila melanogaster]